MRDFKECQRLYENDVGFRQVVDTLLVAIERHLITPDEVRSAAMFAATRFAMLYGYPSQKDWERSGYPSLEDWERDFKGGGE